MSEESDSEREEQLADDSVPSKPGDGMPPAIIGTGTRGSNLRKPNQRLVGGLLVTLLVVVGFFWLDRSQAGRTAVDREVEQLLVPVRRAARGTEPPFSRLRFLAYWPRPFSSIARRIFTVITANTRFTESWRRWDRRRCRL
jgi:hypothetical protein